MDCGGMRKSVRSSTARVAGIAFGMGRVIHRWLVVAPPARFISQLISFLISQLLAAKIRPDERSAEHRLEEQRGALDHVDHSHPNL